MEIYKQDDDIVAMGVHVKTFPGGIKETFDKLITMFGNNRSYYGISWCDENDSITYYAMAQENFKGEAIQHNYETFTIEKGEYVTETLFNWLSQTDCIRDILNRLTEKRRPDKNRSCIELYKSNEEMACMVKVLK
jgi:predicted transcriptional regulator YdeE